MRASKTQAQFQFRLRVIHADNIAVGPGKVALLEAIVATGSITQAAKQLEMSYRRAWLLVDTMNRSFASPVVDTAKGGSRGGGAAVTRLGEEVIRRYRRIEALAHRAGAKDIEAFARLLAR